MQTANALTRLRGCASSPEPSLVAYVISTIISWAGSNNVTQPNSKYIDRTAFVPGADYELAFFSGLRVLSLISSFDGSGLIFYMKMYLSSRMINGNDVMTCISQYADFRLLPSRFRL